MKTRLLLVAAPLLLAALPVATRAQAPAALAPMRNALGVPRATAVQATFAQPPAGGSLSVFSAQAGGKKAGTATTTGNTLAFTPTAAFKPGETVTATLTAASGPGHVWQFTAATGGGTGAFGGGSDFNIYNNYTNLDIQPGDFDNDGDLDVVLINQQGGPSLYVNDGTGTFTSGLAGLPSSGNPTEVAIGDIDGDGDLDVVAAPTRPYSISVSRNNGGLRFTSSDIATNPMSLEIAGLTLGDVDADGDLDLCCLNTVYNSKQIIVWPNDGNGNFGTARTTPITLTNALAMRLSDLDNDGDLDLAVFNRPGGNNDALHVYLNNGTGAFTAGSNFPISSYNAHMTLADVDGDGDVDIASGDYGLGQQAHLYLNNGSATFTPGQIVPLTSAVQKILFGDVDGDGDLDLLTGRSLCLNAGNGTFTPGADLPISSRGMNLADLNGDNALDIITVTVANSLSHEFLNVRLNGAVTSTSAKVETSFQLWPNPVAAGDAIYLRLPTAVPAATCTLQTLLGQTVRTQTFSGHSATVARTGLSSGVYLLTVQVPGQLPTTHKVVLE